MNDQESSLSKMLWDSRRTIADSLTELKNHIYQHQDRCGLPTDGDCQATHAIRGYIRTMQEMHNSLNNHLHSLEMRKYTEQKHTRRIPAPYKQHTKQYEEARQRCNRFLEVAHVGNYTYETLRSEKPSSFLRVRYRTETKEPVCAIYTEHSGYTLGFYDYTYFEPRTNGELVHCYASIQYAERLVIDHDISMKLAKASEEHQERMAVIETLTDFRDSKTLRTVQK